MFILLASCIFVQSAKASGDEFLNFGTPVRIDTIFVGGFLPGNSNALSQSETKKVSDFLSVGYGQKVFVRGIFDTTPWVKKYSKKENHRLNVSVGYARAAYIAQLAHEKEIYPAILFPAEGKKRGAHIYKVTYDTSKVMSATIEPYMIKNLLDSLNNAKASIHDTSHVYSQVESHFRVGIGNLSLISEQLTAHVPAIELVFFNGKYSFGITTGFVMASNNSTFGSKNIFAGGADVGYNISKEFRATIGIYGFYELTDSRDQFLRRALGPMLGIEWTPESLSFLHLGVKAGMVNQSIYGKNNTWWQPALSPSLKLSITL
jgi:hypothetical protein